MKRLLLSTLMLVLTLTAQLTFGQIITNYAFTASSSTFTQIVGGTSVATSVSAADFLGDTKTSVPIPLGFTFYYMGVPYTQVVAMSDGYLSFNLSATSSLTNNLTTGTLRPLVAPLWDDLDGASGAGSASYITEGSVGSRVFTIEWINWQWNYAATGNTISFQVKLYEGTGKIDFIYRQESGTVNSGGASIGIAAIATGSGNFLSLNGTGISPTASSTTETTTLSTKPATGQVYTFTPPSGSNVDPITMTFTSISGSGMTVNWVDNSTNETFFNVTRALDAGFTTGLVYSTVASTTTAGTGTNYSSVVTGLTPGITYYFKITAANEGLPPSSPGLIGSQATTGAATYYWVGTATAEFNASATWNTQADGLGSNRTTPLTTDILIIDGAGTIGGSAITAGTVDASVSVGVFRITNNTSVTLASLTSTTRTISITGGVGDDLDIQAGSTLILNSASNALAINFTTGSGMTGNIAGTLTFGGSTSNTLTTTGGTGTVVTVTSSGIVNLGAAGNSLVGSAVTLNFVNGSNCNSSGATTGAPPVPLATWGTTSNLTITGITSSSTGPTNNAQTFGNITYNCPAASGTMSFWATTTTAVIQGNLTIAATNTGKFRALTSGTLTINGNLVLTAGTFEVASSTGTLNVLSNVTVNGGTFDIAQGGASTLKIAGNFIQNAGTILQTSTSGLLEFNGTSAQTLTLIAGSHGINVINAKINNTAGVNLTSVFSIRNLTVTKGNLTGAGSLTYSSTASVLTYNSTTGTQTSSSVEFPSSNGPFSLTINNTATSPNNVVTVPFSRSLTGTAGVLTLTAGILDNSGYALTITNTAVGGISGGSATSYVKGAIIRNLPLSLATGTTYVFPVGKGTYNPFSLVNPLTNSGGTVTISAEVIDANCGGTAGTNMGSLNTDRYWAVSITAGVANFTSSLIRLNDASVIATSAIASSATLAGVYNIVGGTNPTIVIGTSVTSEAPAAASLPGFFVIGIKAVSMTYTSSTTTQASTASLLQNSTNQVVIGMQVVTTGNTNPLDVTKFTVNANGTTAAADVSNAKIWYTGNSSTFATTTQFGTTFSIPTLTSFDITGTQSLLSGTNYFWLTFDIPLTATSTHFVDAECTVITVGGTALPPTATAPSGNRSIVLNPPTALTATAVSTSQINLTWTKNSVGQDVIIATNNTSTFGTPVNGTNYNVNDPITGGGTIIYKGPLSAFNHTSLTSNTAYYYKEWSVDASNYYSTTGITANATTLCSPSSVPFVEDFITTSTPACWTITGWTIGSTRGVTGNPANNIYKNLYSSVTTGLFTTIDIGSISAGMNLTFDYKVSNYTTPYDPPAAGSGNYIVAVSTNGGQSYTDLVTVSNNGVAGYQAKTIDLSAYVGQFIKIKFTGNWVSGDWDMGFDNIKVEVPPSCLAPTVLTSSNISTTSATISWTASTSNPSGGYEYEVRTSGAGGSGATGLIVSGSTGAGVVTANISGLTANTTYYFYVRSNCGSGSFSTWAGAGTFFTGYCVPTGATNYYLTNVVTTGGVTNISNATGASSGGYGNYSSTMSCSNYIGVPTSIALTPSSSTNYYYCWIDWNNDLDFADANETIFATTSYTSNYTGTINIPAGTANGNYRMRVANSEYGIITACGPAANGEYEDYTFSVVNPPSCLAPTVLTSSNISATSATISWTASTSAPSGGYEYEVRTSGAGGSGATGLIVSGSTGAGAVTANVSGLTANTTYYFYVRSNCGSGSFSTWAGPGTFTTLCLTSDVPYTIDFEDVTVPALPACTVNVNEGQGNNWVTASSPGNGFTSKTLKYGYSGTYAANTWFFTNALNLTANTTYRIEFDYGNNSTSYTEKLKVAYGTSKTGAGMSNVIADFPSINSGTLQHVYYDFTPSSSDVFYFGFQAYSDADEWNLYVDNINIYVKPCPDPYWTVLPANATSTSSTGSCVDGNGWTHYLDNSNNLLLSLKLGGTGAVVTNVSVDPDGLTDAVWVPNEPADGFPHVAAPGTGAAFMKRKWNVNASTQPSSNVDVRFYFTNAEYIAVNTVLSANSQTTLNATTKLNFYKVTTSGMDPWSFGPLANTDVAVITYNSTSAGINSWVQGTQGTEFYAEYKVAAFSGGGAGGADAGKSLNSGVGLPLELLSFKGHAGKSVNVLEWTTAGEVNTEKFIVERSIDGNKWEYVADVNASGNSKAERSYTANDEKPYSLSYYRLKMMDRDGRFSYSKNISIERKDNTFRLYSVSPNPNNGNFAVTFNSIGSGKTNLVVVNSLGMKVYSKSVDTKAGTNNEFLGIDNLTDGIYTLILEQNGQIVTQRIAINK